MIAGYAVFAASAVLIFRLSARDPHAAQPLWFQMASVMAGMVAAFAGGWAVANLFDFGPYGVHIMQGLFFLCGIAVMISFVRNAQRVEPFVAPR